MAYDHLELEPRWQQYWEQSETFKAERRAGRPKYYVLDMFPYPSGHGLHVGHPEGYTRDGHRRSLQSHARLSTCCTRWGGTRSGSLPSSTP